jgi:hypothetical protein
MEEGSACDGAARGAGRGVTCSVEGDDRASENEAPRMKRRNIGGIPKIALSFGNKDSNPFAPLHRRLGIVTFVHRQAVTDYVGGFDQERGVYYSPHEYRARVTLPKVL